MSIRSLIEINHDFTWRLDDPEFVSSLQGYLSGGSTRCADALRSYGFVVVGQRHHSGDYRIEPGTDGFSTTPARSGERRAGE